MFFDRMQISAAAQCRSVESAAQLGLAKAYAAEYGALA